MSLMMCPKCSLELSQVTLLCPLCGQSQDDIANALAPRASTPRPAPRTTPVPATARALPSPLAFLTIGLVLLVGAGTIFLSRRAPTPSTDLTTDPVQTTPPTRNAGDPPAPAAAPDVATSLPSTPERGSSDRPLEIPAPMPLGSVPPGSVPLGGAAPVAIAPPATPVASDAPVATIQIESVAFPPSVVGGAGTLVATRSHLSFTPTKTRDGTAKILQVADVMDVHLALRGAKTSVELRLRDGQPYRFGVAPSSVGELERMLNTLHFANRP